MATEAVIRNLSQTPGVACPCGTAYRVLTGADGAELSVHFVEVSRDSRPHWHTRLTEVYVVTQGSGELELDGAVHRLEAGSVAVIPPGVRHRAVPGPEGLTIVNIVRPPFDPEDEHHD